MDCEESFIDFEPKKSAVLRRANTRSRKFQKEKETGESVDAVALDLELGTTKAKRRRKEAKKQSPQKTPVAIVKANEITEAESYNRSFNLSIVGISSARKTEVVDPESSGKFMNNRIHNWHPAICPSISHDTLGHGTSLVPSRTVNGEHPVVKHELPNSSVFAENAVNGNVYWPCVMCKKPVCQEDRTSHLSNCIRNYEHKPIKEIECSEENTLCSFTCDICKEDISLLNFEERCGHMNRCLDSGTEGTVQPSKSSGNNFQTSSEQTLPKTYVIRECPLCLKTCSTAEARFVHIKKCSKTMGVSIQSAIMALQLQAEHVSQRLALGLPPLQAKPAVTAANSKPSKKIIREPKSQVDADIQLAKAMSLSMGEDVRKQEENDIENISFEDRYQAYAVQLEPPKNDQKPGKRKKKNAQKAIPFLLLQTDEERMKLLEKRVSAIIAPQSPAKEQTEKNMSDLHETCTAENALEPVISGSACKECRLWTLCGAAKDKPQYYVPELMDFIVTCEIETGSKLRSLSQVPGHQIYTQKAADFTFSDSHGTQESASSSLKSPVKIPSTQEMLDVIVDHRDEHNSCYAADPDQPLSMPAETESYSSKGFFKECLSEEVANPMVKCLETLVGNMWMSDVEILAANEETVPAHKLLLALRCPALKQEFDEAGEKKTLVLNWQDVSRDGAWYFLNYMYTGCTKWPSNLSSEVLLLAQRCNMKDLQTLEEQKLYGKGNVVTGSEDSLLGTVNGSHSGNTSLIENSLEMFGDDSCVPEINADVEPVCVEAALTASEQCRIDEKEETLVDLEYGKCKTEDQGDSEMDVIVISEGCGGRADWVVPSSCASQENTKNATLVDLENGATSPDLFVLDSDEEVSERVPHKSPYSPINQFQSPVSTNSDKSTATSLYNGLKSPCKVSVCSSLFDKETLGFSKAEHHGSDVGKRCEPLDMPVASEDCISPLTRTSPFTSTDEKNNPAERFNQHTNSRRSLFRDIIPQKSNLSSLDGKLASDEVSKITDCTQMEFYEVADGGGDHISSNPLHKNKSFLMSGSPDKSCSDRYQLDITLVEDAKALRTNSSNESFSKAFDPHSSNSHTLDNYSNSAVHCSFISDLTNTRSNSLRDVQKETVHCTSENNYKELNDSHGYFKELDSKGKRKSSLLCEAPEVIGLKKENHLSPISTPNQNTYSVCIRSPIVLSSDDDGATDKENFQAQNNALDDCADDDVFSEDHLMSFSQKSRDFIRRASPIFSTVDDDPFEHDDELVPLHMRIASFKNAPEKTGSASSSVVLSEDDESPNIVRSIPDSVNFAGNEKSVSSQGSHEPQHCRTPAVSNTVKKMPTAESQLSESPITPMPCYNAMATPEIKKALKKFGVRALPRKKAVTMLTHIYEETHPWVELDEATAQEMPPITQRQALNEHAVVKKTSPKKRKKKPEEKSNDFKNLETKHTKKAHTSKDPQRETSSKVIMCMDKNARKEEELSSSQTSSNSEMSDMLEESTMTLDEACSQPTEDSGSLKSKIHDFVQGNNKFYARILMYQPLNLTEFQAELKDAGIKISSTGLMDFLDEQCITFTLPRSEKARKKQQARSQRFRKQMIAKSSQQSSTQSFL